MTQESIGGTEPARSETGVVQLDGYSVSAGALQLVMRAGELAKKKLNEPDIVEFIAPDPNDPGQDMVWREERDDTKLRIILPPL